MVARIEVLECDWCGKFFKLFQVSQVFKTAFTYYYCSECNVFVCPKCLVATNNAFMKTLEKKTMKKGHLWWKKIQSEEGTNQVFFCKTCHNSINKVNDLAVLRKLRKEKEEEDIKALVGNSLEQMRDEHGKVMCPYCGDIATGERDYCTSCGAYLIS
nr:hypothetical protein [Candidatus Sigynarchaeum springense]